MALGHQGADVPPRRRSAKQSRPEAGVNIAVGVCPRGSSGDWMEGQGAPEERMSRSAGRPTWTSGSGEVEPVEVHDLVPRGHEVPHELLLRVVTCIDL